METLIYLIDNVGVGDDISGTILVTGGAGFIGSNFVKQFTESHPETGCIVLDKLTYAGNIHNLQRELEKEKIVFVRGDISDKDVVEGIFTMHSPNIVVNFAAESHVDRSITGPQVFMETNILGTQNLLGIAKKHWEIAEGRYVEDARFIQISTDEVYGSLGDEGCFTESSPLNPRSPYSASKTSADLIVRAYHHTYGFPGVITRCSNNYGPYQFPEKLIPLMIRNILAGKPLPIYGDGKNVRDWIYVTDHCTAIMAVVERGKAGEVYNIGGSNEKQNIDIVKLLIDEMRQTMEDQPEYRAVLETPLENINYDLITFVKDRLGHDFRYAIDSNKIRRELGWMPSVTFEEGMRRTIKWYLDNVSWIRRIESGEYLKLNDNY